MQVGEGEVVWEGGRRSVGCCTEDEGFGGEEASAEVLIGGFGEVVVFRGEGGGGDGGVAQGGGGGEEVGVDC